MFDPQGEEDFIDECSDLLEKNCHPHHPSTCKRSTGEQSGEDGELEGITRHALLNIGRLISFSSIVVWLMPVGLIAKSIYITDMSLALRF